uniref:PPUP9330 n=1 Tax=Poeciliopsis prolifica TaxID=188132 RepID=A0A0S7EJ40_9TELE
MLQSIDQKDHKAEGSGKLFVTQFLSNSTSSNIFSHTLLSSPCYPCLNMSRVFFPLGKSSERRLCKCLTVSAMELVISLFLREKMITVGQRADPLQVAFSS